MSAPAALLAYVGGRCMMAVSGVLFQAVAIGSLGLSVTGGVNALQLFGLVAALMILPGLEIAVLRALPMLAARSPGTSLMSRYMADLCVLGMLGHCLTLLAALAGLTLLQAGEGHAVALLATVYFLSRLFVAAFRSSGAVWQSVLVEQGALLYVMVVAVLGFVGHPAGPVDIVLASIAAHSLLGISLHAWLYRRAGKPGGSDESDGQRRRGLLSAVRREYGLPVAVVALGNLFMLWGASSIVSLVLQDEQTALLMNCLRVIGVLLFVEGALVGYHLPGFLATCASGAEVHGFGAYRLKLLFGSVTIMAVFALVVSVTGMDPGRLFGGSAMFFVVVAGLPQLLVCALGSPVSILNGLGNRGEVLLTAGLGLLPVLLSLLVAVKTVNWVAVIIGFSVAQILRSLCAATLLHRRYRHLGFGAWQPR